MEQPSKYNIMNTKLIALEVCAMRVDFIQVQHVNTDLYVKIRSDLLMDFKSPHDRKVLTVALMSCRHTGQSFRLGAQFTQVTRCPHGKNTTPTSSSIQILHSRASLSRRTSSSRDGDAPPTADWSITHCDKYR
jgi:hypothetical protein